MARKISSALIYQFTKPLLSEYYLAIIPASTSYKTSQRFRNELKAHTAKNFYHARSVDQEVVPYDVISVA